MIDIFPISEARESGQYCRELSRWIVEMYRAGNTFRRANRDAMPISKAVRDLNHESFITAAAAAIKTRRERNCILRSMKRHPGFRAGYMGE